MGKRIKCGDFSASFSGLSESDGYFAHMIVNNAESEFFDIASAILHSGSVAVDIGANIGLKSFILSNLVGDTGKVLSIEASPRVSGVLKENAAKNNWANVTVENAACSDKNGVVEFYDNSAWGHIDSGKLEYASQIDNAGKIVLETLQKEKVVSVSARTLDEIMEKFNPERLDFIKIDTEGHELSVLKGAEMTIEKFTPYVYVEFVSLGLSVYGNINPKDFIEYLYDRFKFVFQVKKQGGGKLRHINRSERFILLHDNMVDNHSVDDLLVTNRPDAMNKLKTLQCNKTDGILSDMPRTTDQKLDELLRLTNRMSRSLFINPGKWIRHKLTKLTGSKIRQSAIRE